MAGFLLRLLVVALGLWLATELVPGIAIQGPWTLLGTALLLGLVNAIMQPLLILLTLPITMRCAHLRPFPACHQRRHTASVAWVLDDFAIAGFWPAIGGALVVSLTSWLASWFIGPRGRFEVIYLRSRHDARRDD